MKVMVVDDSIVFRTQISASLKDAGDIDVVGTASNGRICVQKLEQISVDLITLDMEMPEMNGMETIREIKRKKIDVKIIVFSSQTTQGAQMALEALRLGADDVVAKPSSDNITFENAQEMIKSALIPRILQFKKDSLKREPVKVAQVAKASSPKIKLSTFFPKAVVIASSTGGPNALDEIFSKLKGPFSKPIFIVQHMPPVFTQILAKRLFDLCGVEAAEAIDGEIAQKNRIYVAPGGYHLYLQKVGDQVKIKLDEAAQRNSVRPAADFLFESAADIYSSSLLGIVLTGMGEDGADGCKKIHEKGGAVMIQDKESCVVFGMPGAVFANDNFDEIKSLDGISTYLKSVLV